MGPYTETEPVATTVPEPDVSPNVVPGCNILNQFSIANYTGPIPCETNASAPCQVSLDPCNMEWRTSSVPPQPLFNITQRFMLSAEHDRQGCVYYRRLHRHWPGCSQPVCSCWCHCCWNITMALAVPYPSKLVRQYSVMQPTFTALQLQTLSLLAVAHISICKATPACFCGDVHA